MLCSVKRSLSKNACI